MFFHAIKKWNEFRPTDWQKKQRKVKRRGKNQLSLLFKLTHEFSFIVWKCAPRASIYVSMRPIHFFQSGLFFCARVSVSERERDLLLNHFTPSNQKIYQMHTNKCKWKRNKVTADFFCFCFPCFFRFLIFHVLYYRHATHSHTHTIHSTVRCFNRENEWTTPRSSYRALWFN